MREAVEDRVIYFHYLLKQQDELKIIRWKKQLIQFLDEIESYLQQLEGPWNTSGDFIDWYDNEEVTDDSDMKEDYQLWHDGQLLQ